MYSLHPVRVELVNEFLAAVSDDANAEESVLQGRVGLERMLVGDSRGPNLVTHALAAYLTSREPAFVMADVSLSGWEASIDRGTGMLMRPPSRLFVEAGMDRQTAQRFPIRLDAQSGPMAGAYVPATLIPQLRDLLETRLQRLLIRLRDAELEPVLALGIVLYAVRWADENHFGLLEAVDVLHPGMNATGFVQFRSRKDLDPTMRAEFEELLRPPKKPGKIARMFGKAKPDPSPPE